MAFETYQLSSLRDEVKTEFGLSGTDKDSVVDKVINDAIRWIIRKRDGLWPWQIKQIAFDIQPQGSGTLDATEGANTATWISGTKPTVPSSSNSRQIIGIGETSVGLRDGFLVTSFVDPTITLDAEYTGATASGLDHVVLAGYYILPEDFQRMLILVDTSVSSGRVITKSEEDLEWLRRDQAIATGLTHRYAVTKDPLPEGNSAYSSRLFALIYPHPGERKTIRGQYVADHQTLAADADIPLIPQNNRDVIFRVANMFFAMKLKDASLITFYKEIADEALRDMLRFYDFTSDITEDAQLDEIDIGPVLGPPNLPAWRIE